MKNIILSVLAVLVIILTYRSCNNSTDETIIKADSALIQEQLKNVGKLVVTEGHFSQVFTYETTEKVFLVPMSKKAIVVVNADVTLAYDLSQIKFKIDEENKVLEIIKIPTEELKINTDFEYFDIKSGYLAPFNAKDYNSLKKKGKKAITAEINKSDLRNNAKNRLISELSKFYILTNSLGWTLQYNESNINDITTFKSLKDLQNIKL